MLRVIALTAPRGRLEVLKQDWTLLKQDSVILRAKGHARKRRFPIALRVIALAAPRKQLEVLKNG